MDIGIDIGGSHIGVGLIGPNGKIIKVQERYIKDNKSLDNRAYIVEQIVSILKKWNLENESKIDHIGIGAPGNVQDDEIKYSVNLGLYNFKLAVELKDHFPEAKIKILNDAKCAALAEKRWGSLKSFDDCIFLCLGTGIGGAAFYNGKLVKPKRSAGFEYGHMVIEKDGRQCKCGTKGCFEQYASMRRFKNDVKEALNLDDTIVGSKLLNIVNENMNIEPVKSIINNYIRDLCIGISNIVNILEPQAICLGGGFVKYKNILFQKFKNEFYKSENLFYKENKPEVVLAELGNDAGMIGSTLIFDN